MGETKSPFGHNKRENFFLSPGFTSFNHGSFGTVPRPVKSAQDKFFEQVEAFPDKWFKHDMFDHFNKARNEVSSLIHASRVEDVVLVENASAAINSVLRGLCATSLQPGDAVLILSTAYNMVKEVLGWMASVRQIHIVTANIDFPVAEDKDIIGSVRDKLMQHPNIKICIFSHITSIPSIIIPVKELVQVCKSIDYKNNLYPLTVIDGAHAPGTRDIFVEEIDADFYTGNLHKWCFTPKGCAFLWTKPQNQSFKTLPPVVISSSGLHDFSGRFAYTGTRDYTAFASIPTAFDFCRDLGGLESIRSYNHELAIYGASLCAKRWATSLIAPKQMLSTMADVILPTTSADEVKNLEIELEEKHKMCIKTEFVRFSDNQEVWICRLSGQIYLEKTDFEKLADLVWNILKRNSLV